LATVFSLRVLTGYSNNGNIAPPISDEEIETWQNQALTSTGASRRLL
jgi:hypothetical protein